MIPAMNRQQRRMMEKQQARVRAGRRVERAKRAPMLVATDLVLRPLEAIIDQINRDGTVHTDAQGFPDFRAGDGKWYEAAGAIEGVIWHFEMWCTRHNRTLPLEPLRELHIALKYLVPIREETMAGLATTMPALRRAMATADPDDQTDLLLQTQIRAELDAARATGA